MVFRVIRWPETFKASGSFKVVGDKCEINSEEDKHIAVTEITENLYFKIYRDATFVKNNANMCIDDWLASKILNQLMRN